MLDTRGMVTRSYLVYISILSMLAVIVLLLFAPSYFYSVIGVILEANRWVREYCSVLRGIVELCERVDELSKRVKDLEILLYDLLKALREGGLEIKPGHPLHMWILRAESELKKEED